MDVAKHKRKPVRVGDVIIDGYGDVTPVEPIDPENLRDLRAQLRERDRTLPALRIPAPYVADKFLTADFDSYLPTNSSQLSALAAAKDFCKEIAAGRAPMLALIGSTGTGKCLGRGTPVLMFDGSVRAVEDVRGGDVVMGPDSTPRNVSGVVRGRGPLYRVLPTKGDPYVVNGNHILALKMSGGADARAVVTLPVPEYLQKSKQFRHRAKGFRVPVEFSEKSVAIEPYFLGVWLGDGDSDRPMITNADPEVVDYLRDYARRLGLTVSERVNTSGAISYRVGSSGSTYNPNPITVALREYGLLDNKHIPLQYRATSREARLQLLAGLLDADGAESCGGHDIVTKYPQLAADLAYLCRSLGFAAYVSPCMKTATNTVARTAHPYYRLSISGDMSIVPFRVPRRRCAPRLQKKDVLVTGIKVVPIEEGEYFGFAVDGDHLFVLGDFTVTHNSHLLYSAAKALHASGSRVFTRPWYLLADHLRYGGPSPFGTRRMESHELRDAIMAEPIFMIDEVRPTAGTDFDDTELAKIVCRAWDNGRAMLITTNVSPLAAVLGPAVASRFTQITITGPDHRQSP